jgi:circadian clock protein KaiC
MHHPGVPIFVIVNAKGLMKRKPPETPTTPLPPLAKTPIGIEGLDQILEGGLPRSRSTLVCGGAGSGKTILAAEFLVRGALDFAEPGVFMAFEETGDDLAQNMASFGFPLAWLIDTKKLVVDFVHIEHGQTVETGDYTLEGLFVRLGHAIDSVGAKRVALDSLEVLFAGLGNTGVLRSELRRLFRWLQARGVTSIITCERGDGALTRHGLEEYVSDCVILMDHRVERQFATRRLRVVKYRGSRHGMDEYPFLIGEAGFSVLPITSIGLAHTVSTERISSGVPRLDIMLGGEGFYRGSSVLISGTAGTGKSSMSAHLAHASCQRGERCLMFLFEESPSQVIRNMRSIGIDLQPWVDQGLLHLHASLPTLCGPETHLVTMHTATEQFDPSVVVIDPVNNIDPSGSKSEIDSLLSRLMDYFKTRGITTLLTSLNATNSEEAYGGISISSVDTWLVVRNLESGGERNRLLYVLKSRGMAHSNQVREFKLTDHGLELTDVYVGPGGVLIGTARLNQEALETSEALLYNEEFERRRHEMDRTILALRAQSEALRLELEIAEDGRLRFGAQDTTRSAVLLHDRGAMAQARRADAPLSGSARPKNGTGRSK